MTINHWIDSSCDNDDLKSRKLGDMCGALLFPLFLFMMQLVAVAYWLGNVAGVWPRPESERAMI